MLNRSEYSNLNFCQNNHNLCILASFAVAAYPFNKIPIDNYFLDFCNHHNLDKSNPKNSYEKNFSVFYNNAYKMIECLYNTSNQTSFRESRNHFVLEPIDYTNNESVYLSELSTAKKNLLNLFINKSNNNIFIKSMHSITLGYDKEGYYFYDVNRGYTVPIQLVNDSLSSIGEIGDAHKITEK